MVFTRVLFYRVIWLAKEKTKDSMSQKSFSGSSSQTLVFGGDKQQPEVRLHLQARAKGICESLFG